MEIAMSHTPGPWTIGDENNACCEVLLGTEHNLTCLMDRRDNNTCAEVISRDEMLANALLIAAAPELLKVALHCRDLLMRYEINRINGDEISDQALAKINAAIAKATGGQ
jgi:hypothetical protein